jgi:hypothetical protein
MKAITTNWKTLVSALVVGVVLFFASLQLLAGRPSAANPLPPANVPAVDGPPISNEIQDFPQLG